MGYFKRMGVEDGVCLRHGGIAMLNPQTGICTPCSNELINMERERDIRLRWAHWATMLNPRIAICGREDVKLIVERGKAQADAPPMCPDCVATERRMQGADNTDWNRSLVSGV